MKAKRKVPPLLSSGLLPAWDLVSGFTVRAKGRIAALDLMGAKPWVLMAAEGVVGLRQAPS